MHKTSLNALAIFTLSIALSSCSDGTPASEARAAVTQPSQSSRDLREASMDDGELIEAIVARAPEKNRASIRAALIKGNVVAAGGDPESVELIRTLMSRRAVPAPASGISDEDRRRAEERAANSRQVLVAVSHEVPDLLTPPTTIIRSPGDHGVPLVLVRSDATPHDVEMAVRAAAAAALRDKRDVQEVTSFGIRKAGDVRGAATAFAIRFLNQLRAGTLRMSAYQIPGIGTVEAASVRVAGPTD